MRARTWTVVAVLPLALTACSAAGIDRATPSAIDPAPTSAPAPGREPAARPPAPDPSGAGPAAGFPDGSPGADPSGGRPQDGAEPVAGATFKAGTAGSAEVAVIALRRRGKLLDLVLSITAHAKGAGYVSAQEFTGAGPSAITLVDNVRLKRYLIVRDSENRPLQPPNWIVKAGEPSVRTYTFPAPGPEVKALDVSIGSEPPLRDVPVTP